MRQIKTWIRWDNLCVCVNCRGTTNSVVAEPFKFVKRLPLRNAHCMKFYFHNLMNGGMWWCGRLRQCPTSLKVVGLIHNGVTGISLWHNPSGRTMALGFTQPLTEMRTRNISWVWRQPVRRADNLTTSTCWSSWNLGALVSWSPLGLSRPVMELCYLTYWMVWTETECYLHAFVTRF